MEFELEDEEGIVYEWLSLELLYNNMIYDLFNW